MFAHFKGSRAIGPILLPLFLATNVYADLLSFEHAIARSLDKNLQLSASASDVEAYRSAARQAALGVNPVLDFTTEDFLGTGVASGLKDAEATISLRFALDNRFLSARTNSASVAVEVSAAELRLTRINVAAETARRFLDALAIEAELQAGREAVELARQTLETVNRRVAAGRSPRAELARANAALARAELAREDAEHEFRVAKYRLAAQWGATPPDFAGLEGDIGRPPAPIALEVLKQQLAESPMREKLLTQRRLAEANIALAESRRRDPIEYRLGARYIGASNDLALVAGVSIPIGLRNNNEGNIQAARAQLDKVEAQSRALLVELETGLFALYEGLEHSLHQTRVLREDILPREEEALLQTREAYELGRYGYQELMQAQDDLLQSRRALIAASSAAHRQVIEIERLTGVGIIPENSND